MSTMASQPRKLGVLAVTAAAMLPMTDADAQYYGASTQPPLYPYAVRNSYGVQADQPYAVEVAPNTYMIQRSAPARAYPYVRSESSGRGIINTAAAPNAGKFDRPHKPVDHALVEELRHRSPTKGAVINTTKIVRDPPVVVETQRVVDDPPRIIERRHMVDDEAATVDADKDASRDDTKKRVIQADAEVTILGPDHMTVRLFRKGHTSKANARAE
jgi:hypothetical protein